VKAILTATDKASVRQRDLLAHLVVYYVIALALYMQASYRECCAACWRHPVATRSIGGGEGGGQVRHLASAHTPGLGAAAPAA
jgi:Insertion element 4 transposase N-terminal